MVWATLRHSWCPLSAVLALAPCSSVCLRTPVPVASPCMWGCPRMTRSTTSSSRHSVACLRMPMVGLWVPVLPFLSQMFSAAQTTKLLWKGWNFGVSLAEYFSFHASHRPENSIWHRLTLHKLKSDLFEGIVAPQVCLLWSVASVRRMCKCACCVQGLGLAGGWMDLLLRQSTLKGVDFQMRKCQEGQRIQIHAPGSLSTSCCSVPVIEPRWPCNI